MRGPLPPHDPEVIREEYLTLRGMGDVPMMAILHLALKRELPKIRIIQILDDIIKSEDSNVEN